MGTRMNIARGAMVFLVIVMALTAKTAAEVHVVGDSMGWRMPSGSSAAYANWASQNTFKVGDILVFNFPTGQHDVAKVTKSAFDSCSATGPITLVTTGPANFTLNSTGEEYFICTFGQHCSAGQKLAINVTAAAATPSPSPAPSPATTPSTSPTPTPTTMPTPTPSPSVQPLAPSPSPSGGAGTQPPSPPPAGSVAPGTSPGTEGPSAGPLIPPPPPSSAPRNYFDHVLIMFISIVIGFMW